MVIKSNKAPTNVILLPPKALFINTITCPTDVPFGTVTVIALLVVSKTVTVLDKFKEYVLEVMIPLLTPTESADVSILDASRLSTNNS